jgi:hypothetical protein
MRDDVVGGWRELHKEEMHEFYFSSSIISIMKSMRTMWAEHVERIDEKRNTHK